MQLIGLLLALDMKDIGLEACFTKDQDSNASLNPAKVTDFLPVDAPRLSRPPVNRPETLFARNNQMAGNVNMPNIHILQAFATSDNLLCFSCTLVVGDEFHAIGLVARMAGQGATKSLGNLGRSTLLTRGIGYVIHDQDGSVADSDNRLHESTHNGFSNTFQEAHGSMFGGVNGWLFNNSEGTRLDSANDAGSG